MPLDGYTWFLSSPGSPVSSAIDSFVEPCSRWLAFHFQTDIIFEKEY